MQWIKVEDKMPNDGDTVLVYEPKYPYPIYESTYQKYENLGYDFEYWRGSSGRNIKIKENLITHWMPMPGKPD